MQPILDFFDSLNVTNQIIHSDLTHVFFTCGTKSYGYAVFYFI